MSAPTQNARSSRGGQEDRPKIRLRLDQLDRLLQGDENRCAQRVQLLRTVQIERGEAAAPEQPHLTVGERGLAGDAGDHGIRRGVRHGRLQRESERLRREQGRLHRARPVAHSERELRLVQDVPPQVDSGRDLRHFDAAAAKAENAALGHISDVLTLRDRAPTGEGDVLDFLTSFLTLPSRDTAGGRVRWQGRPRR